MGYFGDSAGVNPVLEFMDATGLNSYAHISASLDSLFLGRLYNNLLGHSSDRLSIRYRLCRYGPQAIIADSQSRSRQKVHR